MLNTEFFIDTNHMCFPFAVSFFFFPPQEKAGALLGSPHIVLDDWVYIYILKTLVLYPIARPKNTERVPFSTGN